MENSAGNSSPWTSALAATALNLSDLAGASLHCCKELFAKGGLGAAPIILIGRVPTLGLESVP